jgi:hypothetical protein
MPALPKLAIFQTLKRTWRKIAVLTSHLYAAVAERILRLPRKTRIRAGLGLAAALLLLTGYSIASVKKHPDTSNQIAASQTATANQQVPAAKLTQGNPDYKTLVPAGKDIKQLGGWTRVSPPDKNPVFAYTDMIGSTRISVSEQPLPKNFKNDTAVQIDELAKGFNANEKITASGTTIHLGTSANGAQSVILTKNNLLILIKSVSPITSNEWVKYVTSLQ